MRTSVPLLAGGAADYDIFIGIFTFGIHTIPLFEHPFHGSAIIFRMLFTGGGANKSGYSNGAFVFDLNCEISYGIYVNGSAKKIENRQKKNDFVSIILRKE